MTTTIMSSGPAPPRLWTLGLTGVAVLALGFVLSILVFMALWAVTGSGSPGTSPEAEDIDRLMQGAAAIVLLGVATQASMLIPSLVAARFSGERMSTRLGLRHVDPTAPRLGARDVALAFVATLFLAQVGELLLVALFDGPSPAIQARGREFLTPTGGWGIALLVATSILPGICEEVLFRGYLQRRLLQRWSPILAISVSTSLFILMHGIPQLMIGIIPLSFWLAYMAWRTGTIWLSVLCHLGNNLIWIALLRAAPPEDMTVWETSVEGPLLVATLLLGAAALFLACRRLQSLTPSPGRGAHTSTR